MNINQQQKQSQQISMTQGMKQSLHVLQLNNIELSEYLQSVMAENPLLLFEENGDSNNENIYEYSLKNLSRANDNEINYENIIGKPKTLNEHLTEQIYISFEELEQRKLAFYLLEQLDNKGYLKSESIIEVNKVLNIKDEVLQAVLVKLKQFEPVGIFSENLVECLKTQLIDQKKYDANFEIILKNLNLVASNDLNKLQRLLNVPLNDIKTYLHNLRLLNPKPSSLFNDQDSQIIGPDIIMKKNDHDEWAVELNKQFLPKLLVDRKYYSIVKENKQLANADYEIIANYYNNANSLVNALDQRANTMLKVCSCIISIQIDFFNYGISYLKPLSLSKISEIVGLHESTISRVCNNKFIMTPFGLLPIKYFFSKSIDNQSQDLSNKSIMNIIKEIIMNETLDNILSDDMTVNILKQRGITIARRTVAKYRENLKILSSSARKKQKIIKNNMS